jgi:hypothetical protein
MIVILDTAKGEKHEFKFRKDAAEFISVSLPTLRTWLKEPFYLHKTLIITFANNGTQKKATVQRSSDQEPIISLDNSRPNRTAEMDRAG